MVLPLIALSVSIFFYYALEKAEETKMPKRKIQGRKFTRNNFQGKMNKQKMRMNRMNRRMHTVEKKNGY